MSKPKRPKDTNQLAKMIVDISTGNTKNIKFPKGKASKDKK
jgi:hypothetical protein